MTLTTPASRRRELDRLFAFGAAACDVPVGFGYLGDDGTIDPAQGIPLWITSRMTHVYGLAHLRGRPGDLALVERGLAALRTDFHDQEHGGWYGALRVDGTPADQGKAMYEHAFVVLAASTATVAGVDGAADLLADALRVVEQHFWDESAGACRESWDREWRSTEAYRGANSNMHAVEAFLAAGDATGDPTWPGRALRIAELVIGRHARENGWRLPEHFTPDWEADREYNRDEPRHRFRPYGVTIGHLLEWSRLLLHLEVAVPTPPAWLREAATALFDTAMRIGWEADGRPGLVYTVDWDDRPVVAERMHWVALEAAMAAHALATRTGDPTYAEWAARSWADSARFVDPDRGGWWHELAPGGEVSRTVWTGKPDTYHAVQAMLLPDLPWRPSLAGAARA